MSNSLHVGDVIIFRGVVIKLERISGPSEVGEILLRKVGVVVLVDKTAVHKASRPEEGEMFYFQ